MEQIPQKTTPRAEDIQISDKAGGNDPPNSQLPTKDSLCVPVSCTPRASQRQALTNVRRGYKHIRHPFVSTPSFEDLKRDRVPVNQLPSNHTPAQRAVSIAGKTGIELQEIAKPQARPPGVIFIKTLNDQGEAIVEEIIITPKQMMSCAKPHDPVPSASWRNMKIEDAGCISSDDCNCTGPFHRMKGWLPWCAKYEPLDNR
jgi:hypothetical protein